MRRCLFRISACKRSTSSAGFIWSSIGEPGLKGAGDGAEAAVDRASFAHGSESIRRCVGVFTIAKPISALRWAALETHVLAAWMISIRCLAPAIEALKSHLF
jgi:hypothetical protein